MTFDSTSDDGSVSKATLVHLKVVRCLASNFPPDTLFRPPLLELLGGNRIVTEAIILPGKLFCVFKRDQNASSGRSRLLWTDETYRKAGVR